MERAFHQLGQVRSLPDVARQRIGLFVSGFRVAGSLAVLI